CHSSVVISRTSDKQRVVARPWPRGKKRRRGQASHHAPWEAMESFFLPCVATGVSLLVVWCLSGATPRRQPWTFAVPLPHGRNGLSVRRRAMLSPFREPSLCRHAHRALWRSVWLDVAPIIAATACHQRNDVEGYSRFMGGLRSSHCTQSEEGRIGPVFGPFRP